MQHYTLILANCIIIINVSIYTGPTAQSKYTFYNDFLPGNSDMRGKKILKSCLKEEPRTQDSRQGRLLDI